MFVSCCSLFFSFIAVRCPSKNLLFITNQHIKAKVFVCELVAHFFFMFYCSKMPIQGLTFYNGPTYADNLWFSYFQPTENYTSGAIGFNRQMKHASSAVTGLTGIQFGFVDVSCSAMFRGL